MLRKLVQGRSARRRYMTYILEMLEGKRGWFFSDEHAEEEVRKGS
jgi:hypothetical protein